MPLLLGKLSEFRQFPRAPTSIPQLRHPLAPLSGMNLPAGRPGETASIEAVSQPNAASLRAPHKLPLAFSETPEQITCAPVRCLSQEPPLDTAQLTPAPGVSDPLQQFAKGSTRHDGDSLRDRGSLLRNPDAACIDSSQLLYHSERDHGLCSRRPSLHSRAPEVHTALMSIVSVASAFSWRQSMHPGVPRHARNTSSASAPPARYRNRGGSRAATLPCSYFLPPGGWTSNIARPPRRRSSARGGRRPSSSERRPVRSGARWIRFPFTVYRDCCVCSRGTSSGYSTRPQGGSSPASSCGWCR